MALKEPERPAFLLQQRLRREAEHFIEEEYDRRADWRSFVQMARQRAQEQHRTNWRSDVQGRNITSYADAPEFDVAEAMSVALERLAAMLPMYSAEPALAPLVQDFERIARREQAYDRPILPWFVERSFRSTSD